MILFDISDFKEHYIMPSIFYFSDSFCFRISTYFLKELKLVWYEWNNSHSTSDPHGPHGDSDPG